MAKIDATESRNRDAPIRGTVQNHFGDKAYQQATTDYVYCVTVQ